MTDKIILFLVEGPTDEDTLALIYSKIVKDNDIKFEVLHTDITADEEMTVKYIEVRIKKAVDIYLQRNPFCKFCSNGTPILKLAVHSFWFSGTRFLLKTVRFSFIIVM